MDKLLNPIRDDNLISTPAQPVFWRSIEVILIFGCLLMFAGQIPPDVNESHYLPKAKHFWDPTWCAGDLFLGSSFSHWLFYVTTGWLTRFLSLAATAWVGRIVTWLLFAYAWQRLSWRVISIRWFSIFSSILFLLLNDRFHMAGEWVVGGFEAKGIAYGFVLIALGNLACKDWRGVWPWLGAAAAFHVLVGGWAMIACGFAWLLTQLTTTQNFGAILIAARQQSLAIAAGLSLALVGALPPLLSDQSAPSEVTVAARSIYVNHRIAHHLTFDAFPTLHIARFAFLAIVCWLLNRWINYCANSIQAKMKLLFLFAAGSLWIAFGGLLLSGLAEQGRGVSPLSENLLRFYWFRLADFAIPAVVAIACCAVVGHWYRSGRQQNTQIACLALAGLLVAAFTIAVVENHQDIRPRADQRSLPDYDDIERTEGTYRNWLRVCQWVKTETPQDAVFITPAEQQTFKWYTGRSEVVSWKDIPQDAVNILEWQQRLNQLYEPQRRYDNGLMSYSDAQLKDLGKYYGADYLIVPQRQVDLAGVPTKLKRVYPENESDKTTYVVFEF
ncbi:hypothetical protein N9B46_05250 [Mariniblastus sp.]|nr:hypothetical protein [Mariniblastus sp.]